MTDAQFVLLPDRGLVSLTGETATEFLQGLVTNDVTQITDSRAIYAALLTPQGKYLHDFLIFLWHDVLFLDCEAGRRDDLIRRLTRYRLRARIDISDASDAFETFAVIGNDAPQILGLSPHEGNLAPFGEGIVYMDPRSAALGARAILPKGQGEKLLRAAKIGATDQTTYDTLRISLGITDGDPEIEPEKSYPMDYRLDELHGVSFTKGCYVGQEVTARMKSRGLVRKSLIPVKIEGEPPAIGTPVTIGDVTAGELRAFSGSVGLVLVRSDLLDQAIAANSHFEADTARLFPHKAQ